MCLRLKLRLGMGMGMEMPLAARMLHGPQNRDLSLSPSGKDYIKRCLRSVYTVQPLKPK
ncbi:GD16136 [Drosophila simulans]|uniref:GD16136 n=1 Tax=Drosophila simulans TaxID=7240 RepID=B4R698_DROSI|nr:GD16136 [Drosophila simulans]